MFFFSKCPHFFKKGFFKNRKFIRPPNFIYFKIFFCFFVSDHIAGLVQQCPPPRTAVVSEGWSCHVVLFLIEKIL